MDRWVSGQLYVSEVCVSEGTRVDWLMELAVNKGTYAFLIATDTTGIMNDMIRHWVLQAHCR